MCTLGAVLELGGKWISKGKCDDDSTHARIEGLEPEYLPKLAYHETELKFMESARVESNLRDMINNPHLSDITFLCKDGVKVHACRMLLAARCDVLRRMLTNGMVETRFLEIKLHEISSQAFLVVLEFLHLGWIRTDAIFKPHRPDLLEDWSLAVEALRTARFFLLSSLEKVITCMLWKDFGKVFPSCKNPMQQAMGRLNSLSEFMATVHQQTKTSEQLELLCFTLVTVLRPEVEYMLAHEGAQLREMVSSSLRSMSEEAFTFFVPNLQGDNNSMWHPQARDYEVLRLIILWCTSQALEHDDMDEIINAIPSFELARRLLLRPSTRDFEKLQSLKSATMKFSSRWKQVTKLLDGKLKRTTVAMMLSIVGLDHINCAILTGIIVKLGVFTNVDLSHLKALVFHNLAIRAWSFLESGFPLTKDQTKTLENPRPFLDFSSFNNLPYLP